MAYDICCGFECGVSSPFGAQSHWQLGTAATFNTVSGKVRSGARSVRSNPSSTDSVILLGLAATSTVHVWRVYIWFDTLPTVNCLLTASGINVSMGLAFKASDGKIYAAKETAASTYTFGATGITVSTGQWYRLDCFTDQRTTTNTVDGQVNGVAVGQLAFTGSVSNDSRVTVGVSCGILSTPASGDAYFDDFMHATVAADYPIGAGFVNHFTPTSDGTHNVVTASGFLRTLTATAITNSTTDVNTLVSKVPLTTTVGTFVNMAAPASAAEYVECVIGPASGISTPTTGPRLVSAIATTHQAATGAGNLEMRLNDGGTMSAILSKTGVAGTTTIVINRKDFPTAPSTGAAWTAAKFNALRVRFGSPAALDVNPDQYFDGLLIEAEFAATATTQAVTTTAIASGSGANPPTLAQTVIGASVASTLAVTAPTTVAPGPVTITGGTRATTLAVTAPTTVAPGPVTVTGATISPGSATFAPITVTLAQAVTAGTIATTAALTVPTVVVGPVTIISGTCPAGSALSAPTVAPGPVTLTGATCASTLTLAAPTLAAGPVTVTLGTVTSTASLAAPSLAVGPVAVTLGTRASTVTLAAPSLQTLTFVTGGTQPSTLALTAPGVTTLTFVTTGTRASTLALTAPSVATLTLVTTGTAGSTVTFFAPAVLQTGAIGSGTITSLVALGPPAVTTVAFVTAGTIASTATLAPPALIPAVPLILGATIASHATLSAPAVARAATTVTVLLAAIPSSLLLRAPAVANLIKWRVEDFFASTAPAVFTASRVAAFYASRAEGIYTASRASATFAASRPAALAFVASRGDRDDDEGRDWNYEASVGAN